MASLTLVFQEADGIAALHKSQTKAWPKGSVHLVIKALKDTHQPEKKLKSITVSPRQHQAQTKQQQGPGENNAGHQRVPLFIYKVT